ncbi:MAG: tryptophan-rich sensory protein [Chitinophagaceae bacterium]|nr:MAG: tryptophan-rich sensory protein [Chitinophagaceae bacterium]
MKNWMKLLISIGVPVAVGAIAGFFTATGSNSWYQTIEKPSWQPPGWLFGPVWTTLYILMGIALYLVWKSNASPKVKRMAITLWVIQLVFNFFWSFIFFSQHQIDWALAEILVLWFFILLTIIYFARISKLAAWLLVPYISWVSFASLLTYTIYKLNM